MSCCSTKALPPAIATSLGEVDMDAVTRSRISQILQDLLSRADVHVDSKVKPDTYDIVGQRTRDGLSLWSVPPRSCDKFIQTAVHMSTLVYYQSSVDVQVQIALYTALLLFIDDSVIPHEASAEFLPRLLKGSPQLHPFLDDTVDNLRKMADYFPSPAARAIRTSALNFINRTIFDLERADQELSPDAIGYVRWTRIKDGIGEAYAYFIWDKFSFPDTKAYVQAVPDIEVILDYINDVFSFYKEELTGDFDNMIHRRASVSGQDVLGALSDTAEDIANAIDRVRAVLSGDERETWELFLTRYFAFHCFTPRYRVGELIRF